MLNIVKAQFTLSENLINQITDELATLNKLAGSSNEAVVSNVLKEINKRLEEARTAVVAANNIISDNA